MGTTTTDATTGDYSFTDLTPGDYVAVETQPAGYDDVSENEGGADNDDNGNAANNNQISGTVGANETDVSNDFVEVQVVDISLVKTVSNAAPNVGDTVTFTVTVANAGPSDATGVAVEDTLPAGYSGISNISNTGTLASSVISWTGLAITAGSAVTLTYDAIVEATGPYLNVANVTAQDQPDIDSTPGNDPDTDGDGDIDSNDEDDADDVVVTPGAIVDISLVKTVSNAAPNVGDTVTFTVTVANAGPSDATGVAVEDTLPAGYSGISNISNTGTLASSVISWTGLAITAGSAVTLTYDAIVEATGPYLNVANVTAQDQPDIDSTPGNDPDTDGDGDIDSNDEDDADDVVVTPNSNSGTWSGSVSEDTDGNGSGDTPIPGVIITLYEDTNGDGILDASETTVVGTATTDANGDYSISNLVPGDYIAVQTQPAGFTDVSENEGGADDDGSSNPANNNQIAGTVTAGEDDISNDFVEAQIDSTSVDLDLSKAVNNTAPNIGDTVSFTIIVNNAGPSDATGVAVEDILPLGYSGISSISNGGVLSGNIISWTEFDIAVGGSVVLTYNAVVEATGPYLNVASITTQDQIDIDSIPGNDPDSDGDGTVGSPGDEDDADAVLVSPSIGTPIVVPTMATWMLILLALMLLVIARSFQRREQL